MQEFIYPIQAYLNATLVYERIISKKSIDKIVKIKREFIMNTGQEIPVKKPQGNRENPYKLLHFYEEADADMFRGRTEEAERLFQMVKSNFLTVTFGKSILPPFKPFGALAMT